MKFYDVQLDGFDGLECNENNADGMWAIRDDAEQAAKDAVEMAELVKEYSYYTDQAWVDAQAIIERHEGGTGNG